MEEVRVLSGFINGRSEDKRAPKLLICFCLLLICDVERLYCSSAGIILFYVDKYMLIDTANS